MRYLISVFIEKQSMTTTIQPKTVILDINGVLIRSNIARALPCYLEEKAQTDPLTRYNRFRGDRLQPLSHLSIKKALTYGEGFKV